MTNNNQVNWDEIPEDVEAVITFSALQPTYLKFVNNSLYQQGHRNNEYMHSSLDWNALMEEFGDRLHLRPSPITQPIPVTPESAQVESSEVEATNTPEFDWSSVDDDVEAVIVSKGEIKQWLKTEDGHLLRTNSLGIIDWGIGYYKTLDDRENNMCDYSDKGAKLLRRSPATTTPEVDIYHTFKGVDSKPSILTILQGAQQSILKNHGVTGKVKFTVTCSE